MSDHAIPAAGQLHVSLLSWRRLRRLAFSASLISVAAAGAALYLNGGAAGIFLSAEGFVTREHIAIAAAFEGRVTQVFVHPGDRVAVGQKIAVVQSVAVSRTLSDLSLEKAQLISKIAQLLARKHVVADTLPVAQSNAQQTASYLKDLTKASLGGLALNRSIQEMTTASLSAVEHAASLGAEQESLSVELEANRNALAEAVAAYDKLSTVYADGVLTSSVNGDVGAEVASVGQVLSAGGNGVANIYTGENFVLAYLPDSYLSDVVEGQAVAVKARNVVFNAMVARVLPVAEALPGDLQAPNRMHERGRLLRIALSDPNELPVDQHVSLASCFGADCRAGLLKIVRESLDGALLRADQILSSASDSIRDALASTSSLARQLLGADAAR